MKTFKQHLSEMSESNEKYSLRITSKYNKSKSYLVLALGDGNYKIKQFIDKIEQSSVIQGLEHTIEITELNKKDLIKIENELAKVKNKIKKIFDKIEAEEQKEDDLNSNPKYWDDFYSGAGSLSSSGERVLKGIKNRKDKLWAEFEKVISSIDKEQVSAIGYGDYLDD